MTVKHKLFMIISIMLFGFIFLCGEHDVYADGWSGLGSSTDGGGGGCSDPKKCCVNFSGDQGGKGWAIDCSGLSWMYYEAESNPGGDVILPHTSDTFVTDSGTNGKAYVPSSCYNNGKGGFWAFGRNAVNVGYYLAPNNNFVGQQYDVSNDEDSFMFYGHWAPAAWNSIYTPPTPRYKNVSIDSDRAQNVGGYVASYTTDNMDIVLNAYKTYLAYTGQSSVSSLPNGLYAFCYWPEMEKVTVTAHYVTEAGTEMKTTLAGVEIANPALQSVTPNSTVSFSGYDRLLTQKGNEFGFICWKEGSRTKSSCDGYSLNYSTDADSNKDVYAVYGRREVNAHAILLGSKKIRDGSVVDTAGSILPNHGDPFNDTAYYRAHFSPYRYWPYGDTASITRAGQKGFSFQGWVMNADDIYKTPIPYVTEKSSKKSVYVSAEGTIFNIKSLTENTDIYAVYQRIPRILTIKAIDENGNSLSNVSGLADKEFQELHGYRVDGERGTNPKYEFIGFSEKSDDVKIITGTGAADHIASVVGGRGGCTYAKDCPIYYVDPIEEDKTIYAVYRSLARTLTVEADSNSWVRVIRSSSAVGEPTGELTDVKRDYQNGTVTTTVYVGDKVYFTDGSSGCNSNTKYDYVISSEQIDSGDGKGWRDWPAGEPFTVVGDSYIKIKTKDQSKLLTVKYVDTAGSSFGKTDKQIRACYNGEISTNRLDFSPSYVFVGWKDPAGADGHFDTKKEYLSNTTKPSWGYWLSGDRSGSTNLESGFGYKTYNYIQFKNNKIVYAVYAKKVSGLKLSADRHSAAYAYRVSSPKANAPTMAWGGMRSEGCPANMPCVFQDHPKLNIVESTMADVYEGDEFEIGLDRDNCFRWKVRAVGNYEHPSTVGGAIDDNTVKTVLLRDPNQYVVKDEGTVVEARTQESSHTLFEYGYDISGGTLPDGNGEVSGSRSFASDKVSDSETVCLNLSLQRKTIDGYKFLGWQWNKDLTNMNNRIVNENTGSSPYVSEKIDTDPYNIFKYINYQFKVGTNDEYNGVNHEYYAYYAKKYTLDVLVDKFTKVTVKRVSSKYGKSDEELCKNVTGNSVNLTDECSKTIYEGDQLEVTYMDSMCHPYSTSGSSYTINVGNGDVDIRNGARKATTNQNNNALITTITSGKNNVVVKGKSNVLKYNLTIDRAAGSGIKVERNSGFTINPSPYGKDYGAGTGVLYNQTTTADNTASMEVYCGDNLKTTFSLMPHYSWGDYTDRDRGLWGWKYVDFDQATFGNRTGHTTQVEARKTQQGPAAKDYSNSEKVIGRSDGYNDSLNSSFEIVHADVEARTKDNGETRIVRDEFQVNGLVSELEDPWSNQDKKETGWVETDKTIQIDDIECLNYIEGNGGGCKVYFKFDLKTEHGTGTTTYSVDKIAANGSVTHMNVGGLGTIGTFPQPRESGAKKVFDVDDKVYPGQTLCYRISFNPYGSHGNDKSTVTACAKAQISKFQGKTTITSKSGKTENGFTSTPGEVRTVHDITGCDPVAGCDVSFKHELKRTDGIGWTGYKVTRKSNYPGFGDGYIDGGTEYFRTATGGVVANEVIRTESYTEKINLKPGMVVCETFEFDIVNDYTSTGHTRKMTTCASALGNGQPDNPGDSETGVDTPGSTPVGLISDDNVLLNIKVRNDDVNNRDNQGFQKIVYAKPGDNLTYRATYNPVLQYTAVLIPEMMQINGGTVVSNGAEWPLGKATRTKPALFNSRNNCSSNSTRCWNNAFSVNSANFKTNSYQKSHVYTVGDTQAKAQENQHSVAASEVGLSLIEYARMNIYDDTKLTPIQVTFSDFGDAKASNLANVITKSLSRSAFARVPYNFDTEFDLKEVDDPGCGGNEGAVCAGEDSTVSFPVKVVDKKNCLTTNDCSGYTTIVPEARTRIIVYDPAGVDDNKKKFGADSWGPGSKDSDLCAFYGLANNEVQCGYANGGTDGTINSGGGTVSGSFVTMDKVAGSSICVAAAVYPANSGADDNWYDKEGSHTWRISGSKCYTVAKKPSMQAWGGNVYSAGQIKTSYAKKQHIDGFDMGNYTVAGGTGDYRLFGSWGELGVLSGGMNQLFGSAASMGYASLGGGVLSPNPFASPANGNNGSASHPGGYHRSTTRGDICNVSLLTFANATCSGGVGNFSGSGTSSHAQNDKSAIVSKMKETDAENLIDLYPDGNLGSFMNDLVGTHHYIINKDATLGANTLRKATETSAATTIYLEVGEGKKLTIAGDIRYEEPGDRSYSRIDDIPKLVIYAKGGIDIQCNVVNIDALLVTDGTVDTCSNGPKNGDEPNRNASAYSKQLKVFGAVIANNLVLNRTYGAATGYNSIIPAEIFDYDPTLYLWGSVQSDVSKTGTLDVTYTMELSPRYGENAE